MIIFIWLLELFLVVLFAYCILSLVIAYARLPWDSPVIKVQRVLTSIVDPVLRPIRRVIPVARVGNVGLDLSVLILFLVIQVILIPVLSR
jgi:YggT family protein